MPSFHPITPKAGVMGGPGLDGALFGQLQRGGYAFA